MLSENAGTAQGAANEALIRRFYTCFNARDADGMQACYHADISFHDPAFGELDARQVNAMWHMLCARATDLSISCSDVTAGEDQGHARWDAHYTFTQTGRRVHNRVHALFHFRDGLIVRHEDRFDFWRWSRQALGPSGLLLGWTPVLRARVRSTARRGLARFMSREGEGSGAGGD
jgi:ketosteroid isomerase-like protein